jgi:asparagine synthase (glutamine-hydrolysing)
MCGIAGFLTSAGGNGFGTAAKGLNILAGMGSAIAHRGPDDSGEFFLADEGIGLAHRRLSIIDLSPAGHQPMSSACGRYTLVFNGEIYNFLDIKHELILSGRAPAWRGTSDTEVMLAAFCAFGVEAALEKFNGMFAFALWDRQERRLTLARDRAGEKPLYYGMVRGALVFGSELRALCAYPGFEKTIDPRALERYLRFLAVPAPDAIFKDVRKLPPGEFVMVSRADLDAGLPTPKPYWRSESSFVEARANPLDIDMEQAIDMLDATMRRAVGRRMIADVPLGAFLSGGIDSTLVVAMMQAQTSRPVRTFTIGFDDESFDESPFAAAVAKHLGTAHVEARVTSKEALDTILRLPTIYDEPFADSSQIPTAVLCALVRERMTVAMSGDAGDELFGGYQRYFATALGWKFLKLGPAPLRRVAASAYVAAARGAANAFAARRGGLPVWLNPDYTPKIAAALSARDERELYEGFLAGLAPPSDVLRVRADLGAPRLARWQHLPGDLFHKMMYMDFVGYLPDDILVKVDRAAMAVGLETRVPFLDPEIVDFAWRLPLSRKLEMGRGKLILRGLVNRYVPANLMERPKQGFGLPVGAWLRGSLRPWAEELLSEARLKNDGFFDAARVRALWGDHLAGSNTAQPRIWPILMFNAWHDAMRDYSPARTASPRRA